MIVSIIVEGEQDRLLVDAVLRNAKLQQPFEVVAAGGRSSAISRARSYLTLPDRTVALLVDSDTTDRRLILEQTSTLNDLVGAMAPRWKSGVFLSIPELESSLFETEVAPLAFKVPLTEDMRFRGRYEPKKTAMALLGVDQAGYAGALQAIAAEPSVLALLAKKSPFQQLIEFVQSASSAEHCGQKATVA